MWSQMRILISVTEEAANSQWSMGQKFPAGHCSRPTRDTWPLLGTWSSAVWTS